MVPEGETNQFMKIRNFRALPDPIDQLYGYLEHRGLTVFLPTISRSANWLGAWLVLMNDIKP